MLSRHPGQESYVSTKVGVPIETNDFGNREFSAATMLRDVEGQLQRLRRETIDVYLLHSPSVQQLGLPLLSALYPTASVRVASRQAWRRALISCR